MYLVIDLEVSHQARIGEYTNGGEDHVFTGQREIVEVELVELPMRAIGHLPHLGKRTIESHRMWCHAAIAHKFLLYTRCSTMYNYAN